MLPDDDRQSESPPPRRRPRTSVLLWVLWLAIPVGAPLVIFSVTRGMYDGGTVGGWIAFGAVVSLMIASFRLGTQLDSIKPRYSGCTGFVLLILGLVLGLGVFFFACTREMRF